MKTYGIGKITDLFGTDYLHDYVHTEGDQNGLDFLIKNIKSGNHNFVIVLSPWTKIAGQHEQVYLHPKQGRIFFYYYFSPSL